MEIKTDKIIVAGNLDRPKWHRLMKVVLDTRGICTTVNTCGGGNLEPKIMEVLEPTIAAMRGRAERSGPTKQAFEINHSGNSNALTTVQKDNLLVEPIALDEQNKTLRQDGTVGTLTTDGSSPKHNNRVVVIGNYMPSNHDASRVVDSNGLSPTVKENHGTVTGTTTKDYRVRKLTPRECFRLMGFDDSDFDKAQKAGISNSQLYKQAGNSIVVDVLEAIFKEME